MFRHTYVEFLLTLSGCWSGSSTDTCTYNGTTYQPGDAWVDVEGCDVCECDQYGLRCKARTDYYDCIFNSRADAIMIKQLADLKMI